MDRSNELGTLPWENRVLRTRKGIPGPKRLTLPRNVEVYLDQASYLLSLAGLLR